MNKQEILTYLDEPLASLTPAQVESAEQLADADQEIALALRHCRARSSVSEAEALGEPPTSDAVFLVNLRERMDRGAPVREGLFSEGFRLWAAAMSACVILVAGIYVGGEMSGTPESDIWTEDQLWSLSLGSEVTWWGDIEDADLLDPDFLADEFDVSEISDLWEDDYASLEPISDQLLALSPESMEEVLERIEDIQIFTINGG